MNYILGNLFLYFKYNYVNRNIISLSGFNFPLSTLPSKLEDMMLSFLKHRNTFQKCNLLVRVFMLINNFTTAFSVSP